MLINNKKALIKISSKTRKYKVLQNTDSLREHLHGYDIFKRTSTPLQGYEFFHEPLIIKINKEML